MTHGTRGRPTNRPPCRSQELVDCQWQQRGLPVPRGIPEGDVLVWMDSKGFISEEDYPYHKTGPECHVYNCKEPGTSFTRSLRH